MTSPLTALSRISANALKAVIISLLSASLTGCPATPGSRQDPPQIRTAPAILPDSGLETSRAGTSLRLQASGYTDADEFDRASRLLERALRIDSRDPATYYEFARLRLLQGNHGQARELIEKGLSLRPNAALEIRFHALQQKIPAT